MEVGTSHHELVVGLPRTSQGHDAIWVITDQLTKSAHFPAIRSKDLLEKLAQLYLDKVDRLH